MVFCTLFNWAFLPQGIALYRSLDQKTTGNFTLYILCMDDFTYAAICSLHLHHARAVRLSDLEDDTMRKLREQRTIAEYCWTCTTPLLLHVLRQQPPDTVVAYVDADLYFFADPSVMLQEMGHGSIYIHEHGFAPRYAARQATAGRFNVGAACFRNDAQGRACLTFWNAQCFNECLMDWSVGKCGDQNYLDEWPSLYPSLVISTHPGVGLGPWNIEMRSIETNGDEIIVDGRPAVFYHYHSLRVLRPKLGVRPISICGWFEIPDNAVSAFYKPYARELWRAVDDIERSGFSIIDALEQVPGLGMPHQQILLSIGNAFAPMVWSGRIFQIFPRFHLRRNERSIGPIDRSGEAKN